MFAKEIYIRRRSALCGKMGSGLILIPGNMLTPNNYLNNAYYFRQDSSFLYYFGLNTPALVGLIATPERLRCTATTSRSKTSSGRGRSLRCANKGPKQAFRTPSRWPT